MAEFQKMIGHEQVIEHFQNAIKMDKVSHAYIINGEAKSGKKMLAKRFAAALQCEKGGIRPCGECHSCKQVLSENHPDIIRIQHEKPNSIGIEDIREQLVNDIQIKPYGDKYKIYIIDEADKMTVPAQNALLKTIEEPPEYAVIILLTVNSERLLSTISSRCVTLNLKPVKNEVIRKYLMEEVKVPDYKADICVAFAQGNVGKAVNLASASDFDRIKDEAVSIVKTIPDMEVYEVIETLRQLTDFKLEVDDYLDIMMVWYRDVLLYKATNDVNNLIFRDEMKGIQKQASHSSYAGIEKIITGLETAKARLKANVNFDLVMELLLLTIKEN